MTSSLPKIDYTAHPAYRDLYPADPALTAEALAIMEPVVDRMARIEQERVERFGYRFGDATAGARDLIDRGITRDILPKPALDRIASEAGANLQAIRATIDAARAAGQPISFKAVNRILDPQTEAATWAAVDEALSAAGVYETVRTYFSAQSACINSLALFVNPANQAWATNVFRDAEVQTPETAGFHIDSNGKCYLKMILYLSDVGKDQGPLGIIPESHHWDMGSEDRVYRRAFDRSEMLSRAENKRRLFVALPPQMQTKAEFGGDMLPDAPETKDLLAREDLSMGPRGLYSLFDPDAIHRGGNVREGERQVVQVTLRAVY